MSFQYFFTMLTLSFNSTPFTFILVSVFFLYFQLQLNEQGQIVFRPDEKGLVYVSYNDGNSELCNFNLGSDSISLTTTNMVQDNGADWHVPSDKRKILFKSRKTGNDEIFIMNVDGSEVTNLSQHPAEDRRPWWSPDGKTIYFETNRNGNWDIYQMNNDGTDPKPIYDSEAEEKYPGVSDDAQRVCFLHFNDKQMGLFKMKTDGTELQQLTDFNELGEGVYDSYPTWSPDSKMICFASNRDTRIAPTRSGETGLEIYTMQADGSNVQRLTFNDAEDSLPVFSPDGKNILFNSSRTGKYHLYTMLLDGREVTPLTWGDHNNWGARCSKDEKTILFVSDRAGGSDIYSMNLQTGQLRRLTFDGKSGSPNLF